MQKLKKPEEISEKIKSFSHQEFNKQDITNVENIKYRIENLLDPLGRPRILERVEIDNSYPITLIQNQEQWSRYIL